MNMSGPKAGTEGQVTHHGGFTYFWEDNGRVWQMLGGGQVAPVSEDHVHRIAEEMGYAEKFGPEPINGEPWVWPGVPDTMRSQAAKTEPVRVNSLVRQKALDALISDSCKSGDFEQIAPDKYKSHITQAELGEMLARQIGTKHGTSPKQLRDDLGALGVGVEWARSRR